MMTSAYSRIRHWLGQRYGRATPLGRALWQLRLHGPFGTARVRPLLSRLLGPQYSRSRTKIEIDLTYACNLGCKNCNRSVPQAPSSSRMTLGQIRSFIAESTEQGARWDRIRLIGGEPTLHPEFPAILNLLRAYRTDQSPGTVIEVSTNGHGPKVNQAIAGIPEDVVVNNSAKDADGSEQEYFAAFNMAPRDSPEYAHADYANGCRVLKDCGMGLAPGGYYPCAIAAGIDRVLGHRMGRPRLPAPSDDMTDQLRLLCSYCGHFKRKVEPAPLDQLSSPSWRQAYSAYRRLPARERNP